MDGRGRTFLLLQIFFCFFVFASTEETKQNCSQVQCRGPLVYYHDMGCTPVYRNQGDCCAYKYNCDHLDARSPNKCYFNNRSYEIGEYISREDMNVCDVTCVCAAEGNSADFWCVFRHYDNDPSIGVKCYLKRNIHECGPGTIICPENESEIPQCVVNEYTYRAGEIFASMKEPRKVCMCQEGYTGDNTEQFCITMSSCLPFFYRPEDIANKYAPIYDSYEYVATSCTMSWSRQHPKDTVIPNPNGPTASGENSSGGEDLTCKFGNLTMNIGDKLSPNTGFYSDCVRCVCEVPPTPTCARFDYYDCKSEDNSTSRESL